MWAPHGWIMELPLTLHAAPEIFAELTFSGKHWVVSSLETRAWLGSSGAGEGEICLQRETQPYAGDHGGAPGQARGSGSAPACDGSVLANHLGA